MPEAIASPIPSVFEVVETEVSDEVKGLVVFTISDPEPVGRLNVVPTKAEPERVVPEMTIDEPPGRRVDPGAITNPVMGPEEPVMMVGCMVVGFPSILTTRGASGADKPESGPVASGADTTVPGNDVPPTIGPGSVMAAPPAVRVVPGATTNAVVEGEPSGPGITVGAMVVC